MLTSGLGKIGTVGRLLVMSALGGVLVAGLALPAVGVAGVAVRNAANRFNGLVTAVLGKLPVRSEILDSRGHLLAYYDPRGIDRVPVAFSQISPVMRQAIVAIEDSRFYQHGAIDIRGTLRALVNDLEHKPVQGGSTLAQQYVKNVLILSSPNPQQEFANATQDTLGRKIRELKMAVQVEHEMSKNQVLAGYLNAAYFGNQSYGIQVAAERYFATSAAKLTLTQAATLAGIVEDPALYNPFVNKSISLERRNTVIARMMHLKYLTPAAAAAAEKQPLGLHPTAPQSGCTSASAKRAPFFCDYVLAVLRHDASYKQVWARLNGLGGLRIYTTLNRKDQRAAQRAVNYQLPAPPSSVNPGRNADTEVLIQPGTGEVRAMAIDRPYGTGRHQTTVNYAVGPQYDGGEGVQIGSSAKVYTLVTALEQGIPFGYTKHVNGTAKNLHYDNCKGQRVTWPHVTNDQSEIKPATYTLYSGTTMSINTFFAALEKKVGLCNVVTTATKMGLTWPDGRSLLKPDRAEHHPYSADNDPSFTLGADNVAPIDVAAADASLPARGIYCRPVAITKIVTLGGKHMPTEPAACHRVMPAAIADAANHILQGDLTSLGTAGSPPFDDVINRPAASKTGTADNYASAFFVGYTPDLLGAVWVGSPNGLIPMKGTDSCYRGGCYNFMYGSMAPGATWHDTFMHAALASPPLNFVAVPANSPFYSKGNGEYVTYGTPKRKSKSKSKKTQQAGGGSHGGGTGGGGTGGLPIGGGTTGG